VKLLISYELIEHVKQLKHLESRISEDRYCETDIQTRIAMGKKAFMNKKGLLPGKLQLSLKKIIKKY